MPGPDPALHSQSPETDFTRTYVLVVIVEIVVVVALYWFGRHFS